MVACLVRDQEVVGSNPVTPTISSIHKGFHFMNTRFFYLNTDYLRSRFLPAPFFEADDVFVFGASLFAERMLILVKGY